MRIGAMMRSVLPALAQAVVLNSCLPDGKFDQLKEELQVRYSVNVPFYFYFKLLLKSEYENLCFIYFVTNFLHV
jgi:hypothetical protein